MPLTKDQFMVKDVLDKHFAGNQSELSRASGLNSGVISRIVKGKSNPSKTFMILLKYIVAANTMSQNIK